MYRKNRHGVCYNLLEQELKGVLGIKGILYIPIALIVFGILIFIHELGHYITARLFGVKIKEFSIGMGPKIISKKSEKNNIQYSLRALPIGGYVSMEGENEASDDENALNNKPVWQRLIITAAGAAMNLLLGVIVMSLLVMSQKNLPSVKIHSFSENAISNTCGLKENDEIVKINGKRIHILNELVYEIMMNGTEPLDVEVIRDGKRTDLSGVSFPIIQSEGMEFGDADFFVYPEEKNFVNVTKQSFYRSWSTVEMIWDSIIGLITGRFGMETVSGPIGATTAIGEAAASGFADLVYLAVVISMNLGIFNLLPFPALDGGRIFFMIIEIVRGKRINPEHEEAIHFAGLVILLMFTAFVAFKDISNLFG